MKKKYIHILITLLIIFILSVIGIGIYKNLSYSLEGTYSAGNEPDDKNIYLVLKNHEFTVYDQDKILASGSIKKVDFNHTGDIYELVSNDNTRSGYVIHNEKYIVLLSFQDMNFSLKKISKKAIYLDYEFE